jgi:hypothetical protein
MKNFKEIKTTVIGFLLWIIAGVYLAMPFFSDKELWEPNSLYVIGLFASGLALMLSPDRFLEILFGWMKKKAGIILLLLSFAGHAQTYDFDGGLGMYYINGSVYPANAYTITASRDKVSMRSAFNPENFVFQNVTYSSISRDGAFYENSEDVLTDARFFSQSMDYHIYQCIREIYTEFGDRVSVDEKAKQLRKFGRNQDITTSLETIWEVGGIENYPTGNFITKASSSNTSDTVTMYYEGHQITGTNITFGSGTFSLNGQTSVDLPVDLFRLTRMYNNSTVTLLGDVYAYRDGTTVTAGVPQEQDSIHIKVTADINQSLKASTTTSSQDYWIITEFRASVGVSGNQDRKVDFRIDVRRQGKIFRTIDVVTTSNNAGPLVEQLKPHIIIPPGSDIKITGLSSGTSTEATGTIAGYLAIKQ